MRLYSLDASPFAARVRIQIGAKSLPVQIVPPPAAPGSAALRARAITGRIPVLEVEAELIVESAVIMEYLEDRFPAPSLRGACPLQTARLRMVGQLTDLYVVPALQPLRAAYRSRSGLPSCAVPALIDGLDQVERAVELARPGVLTLADCMLAPVLFYAELLTGALLPDCRLDRWPRLEGTYRRAHQHAAAGPVLESMRKALGAARTGQAADGAPTEGSHR